MEIVCANCGKRENEEYTFRLFEVEYKGASHNVCQECFKNSAKQEFWFVNHVPTFVDGATLTRRLFDTKEELVNWVVSNTDSNYIATCGSEDGLITDVRKTEKYWWVRGRVSIPIELPDFKDTIKKLKYYDENLLEVDK